jgi:hypothetical protein
MFFIYLYVLVLGQRHASCVWLLNILSKDRHVVSDDNLDARVTPQVL